MIYYITGLNSRQIKIDEIVKEFNDIKVYDANIQEDYTAFIENISNTSIFSTNELIILKRAEKVKKMKELVEFLAKNSFDNKSIIIDYYSEYKNKNTYLKDFTKMNAEVILVEDDRPLIEEYVSSNLKISKEDLNKLLAIIGLNYNHIKNEIYKYNSVLNNEVFSFDKVKGLISVNEEEKTYEIANKIIYEKYDFNKIPTSMYMGILYNIYNEFEILHKLHKLNLANDYNKFKAQFEKYQNLFNVHYYKVFLINKNLNKFSKNRCFKILMECNKYESMIKSGLIDDKNALFSIYSLINKK